MTLIRFGLQKFSFSFVLLNLLHIDSYCEPRIFALLERKSEEATIAGHPLGAGSLWLSTYFFFRNFATYCSSLLGLRSNIFFVIFFFFRFPALIFAYILMTHKYPHHVFTFSTNPPKKALKKEIKSAKKWNESKRPKNTVGKTLSRSFRVKMNCSPSCCNKDWQYIKRGICCVNFQTLGH